MLKHKHPLIRLQQNALTVSRLNMHSLVEEDLVTSIRLKDSSKMVQLTLAPTYLRPFQQSQGQVTVVEVV